MKRLILEAILPVACAVAIVGWSASANAEMTCLYNKSKTLAFCGDDDDPDGDVWRCEKNKGGKTWRCGATPKDAAASARQDGPKLSIDTNLSSALTEAGAMKPRRGLTAPKAPSTKQ